MMRSPLSARSALYAMLAALPLLLLWPALRHTLEGRMSLHMLLEFPALLAGGWAAQYLGLRAGWLHWIDWRGWTGATLVTLVSITWMLPSLLDLSLLLPAVAAAKYLSWWLAGWWLAHSWRRLDPEVLLFGIGNIAWMTATAGMLYLDTPQRLCVNYLQDDQHHAGIGLVLLALLLGAVAIRRVMEPHGTALPPLCIKVSADTATDR
ncbi:MAG: hypothetical protein IPI75_15325 [Gammaproteobacteria bacterium]|nr:hypothetical protein [Gammaproteobacteria bacterium]